MRLPTAIAKRPNPDIATLAIPAMIRNRIANSEMGFLCILAIRFSDAV